MAPATPSPHRFVSAQQRRGSPTKESRAPSGLRQQFAEDATEDASTPQVVATSSQFASTPRFSFGRPKSRATPSRPPSPAKPAPINVLRPTTRQRDDVVDALPEEDAEDEEMLDDERAQALPTTEHLQTLDPDRTSDLPFSPKRRKLEDLTSDERDLATSSSSPARPGFKRPHTPASQLPKPAPRFVAPHSSHNSVIDEVSTQHRPPFLRQSLAPQQPTEPLPEAFSPHRRGQKFVPGGMAATVQQWVVETGQAAVQSRRGQAYLRGEDFVMRVKVEAVEGNGLFMIAGRTTDGHAINMLLTQGAGGTSSRAVAVKEGDIVGIRAPTWDVDTDGTSWTVGVDWKVIP